MIPRKIIGLIGLKGSGKSTLAELLAARGWSRLPLASPLKDMLRSLLHAQGLDTITINAMLDGTLKEEPTRYLGGRSPRYAMQTLGTEWGRNLIDPMLWLDVWRERVKHTATNIVVEDVRFPNEALLVQAVVFVDRPHTPNLDQHESESQWRNIRITYRVENKEGCQEAMLAQLAAQGLFT